MNTQQQCYKVGLYASVMILCAANVQPEPQPEPKPYLSARELRASYDARIGWYEALYEGAQ